MLALGVIEARLQNQHQCWKLISNNDFYNIGALPLLRYRNSKSNLEVSKRLLRTRDLRKTIQRNGVNLFLKYLGQDWYG